MLQPQRQQSQILASGPLGFAQVPGRRQPTGQAVAPRAAGQMLGRGGNRVEADLLEMPHRAGHVRCRGHQHETLAGSERGPYRVGLLGRVQRCVQDQDAFRRYAQLPRRLGITLGDRRSVAAAGSPADDQARLGQGTQQAQALEQADSGTFTRLSSFSLDKTGTGCSRHTGRCPIFQ